VRRCLFTADPSLSTPTCLQLSAPEAAETMTGKGLKFLLLDVRTDDEFRSGHLPTAFHLPSRLVRAAKKNTKTNQWGASSAPRPSPRSPLSSP
jgi:hypothetical protein